MSQTFIRRLCDLEAFKWHLFSSFYVFILFSELIELSVDFYNLVLEGGGLLFFTIGFSPVKMLLRRWVREMVGLRELQGGLFCVYGVFRELLLFLISFSGYG